ncbi:LOW QUALITY PROTEIN: Bardet-Biedl syndrome 1 protein-like [Saccostrea cucullata]|uniref:LOW QUALITY PROTEIN: Bardet-Biedl syndrome 1 protein-like n=1 Tax=Saccostrea cuccullata TaxID=36930 RepID=UPI002ED49F8C
MMSSEDKDQMENDSIGTMGNDKWLDAYKDPVASLYTLTQCICLSDVQADGDWKLIIADLGTGTYNMKLKVYKGTNLMSEHTIIDLPTGVVTFYMDTHEPRTPAIAVASGPYIYVYKNLRPYFKFTLPTLEVNPVEADLWNQVKEEKINIFVLREMLEGMRAEGIVLTVRSLRFHTLQEERLETFANMYKHTPLKRQGKKLWTVKLPGSMTTMEVIDYKSKGFKAVIVALNNCQVHIYKEKYLVNVIKTDDVVTGLKFGQFGREEGTLIMTLKGGGLMIKILKRNATFEEKDLSGGPPAAQNSRLNVPKKTKLFVDQTMRERESAVTMHRTFQRDLYLLRLNTLREYAKSLDNSMNPISSDPTEPLKLNAQVQGIGPTFKLTVNLQNTSLSQPSTSLLITFLYDEKLYSFKKSFIEVPMLVPGLNYAFETFVECLSDKGVSDNIKVFVLKDGKSVPIITGVISMPVSEGLVVV